jgi:hypothetical protein
MNQSEETEMHLIQTIDFFLFLIAALANLLLAAVFLCRWQGWLVAERMSGIMFVLLGAPLLVLEVANLFLNRDFWTLVLPLPLLAFMVLEYILDYARRKPWRDTWLVWPYMLLYYAGLFGMIGLTFRISRLYGFTTLITYFIQFILSMIALKTRGHGMESHVPANGGTTKDG